MARITGSHTITVSHICPHCQQECGVRTLVEYQGADYWDYTKAKCLGCGALVEITEELETRFARHLDPVGAEMSERQEAAFNAAGV